MKVLKQHNLIVSTLSGRIDSDAMRARIKQALGDKDFVWNMDRLVLLDEKSDMSQLDLRDLFSIKDDVLRAYFGDRLPDPSDLPIYRIAVVCSNRGNAGIVKLYSTVWETDRSPYVDVKPFDTIVDALSWLGRRAVSEEEIRQAAVP
jgi:hypothetical protein